MQRLLRWVGWSSAYSVFGCLQKSFNSLTLSLYLCKMAIMLSPFRDPCEYERNVVSSQHITETQSMVDTFRHQNRSQGTNWASSVLSSHQGPLKSSSLSPSPHSSSLQSSSSSTNTPAVVSSGEKWVNLLGKMENHNDQANIRGLICSLLFFYPQGRLVTGQQNGKPLKNPISQHLTCPSPFPGLLTLLCYSNLLCAPDQLPRLPQVSFHVLSSHNHPPCLTQCPFLGFFPPTISFSLAPRPIF